MGRGRSEKVEVEAKKIGNYGVPYTLKEVNREKVIEVFEPFPGVYYVVESGRIHRPFSEPLSSRFPGYKVRHLSSPPDSSKISKEMHMPQDEQNVNLAQAALKYFNQNHDSDYELVKVLYTISSMCNDGTWYHCNFQAKSRTSEGLKLFFAEKQHGDFEITTCCILDGERVTGCGMCYGPVIHPPSGFRKGDLSELKGTSRAKDGVKYGTSRATDGDSAFERESSSQPTINPYLGFSTADAHLFSTPHYLPELTRSQEEPTTSLEEPTSSDGEMSRLYLLQIKEMAEAALKYYNKKHNSHYAFVESLDSFIFCDADGVWAHYNFKAESKADMSVKLFFAEQNRDHRGRATKGITACCILDGKKTTTGCVVCKGLIHPTSRFRKGRYKSQYRMLRLRRHVA